MFQFYYCKIDETKVKDFCTEYSPEPDEIMIDWLPGELELFWKENLCNNFLECLPGFCKLTSFAFSNTFSPEMTFRKLYKTNNMFSVGRKMNIFTTQLLHVFWSLVRQEFDHTHIINRLKKKTQ